MFKKLGMVLVVVFGFALALFAACAGPGEKEATPGGTGAEALPTATPLGAEAKPIQGGWLRGALSDPGYWSPLGGTAGAHPSWHGHYYSTLVTLHYGPGTDPWSFEPNPAESLAKSWDISADGLTYTFHLRQGVRWQDKPPVNGREFVAEDVKWSYEIQIGTLGAPRREFLRDSVDAISCPDRYTVVIKLKAPRADFITMISSAYAPILAREVVDVYPDLGVWQAQIGTGPFILAEYTNNIRSVFKRNPTYYLAPRPYLDGIYNVVIADAATGLAAFRAGRLDIRGIDRIDLASLKNTNPDVYCYEQEIPGGVPDRIIFRTDRPPFNDVRLRQAFSMAFDRQAYIDTFYYGYGVAQLGQMNVADPWFLPDQGECAKYYQYNPAEAKKLLVEAGYPGGLSITMNCYRAGDKQEYLLDVLAKAGFMVTLKPMDYGAYQSTCLVNKNYEHTCFMLGGGGGTFGPDSYFVGFADKEAAANYSRVDDPYFEAMVDGQSVEMDPVKRRGIINEMQRYFACQQYYVHMPWYYAVTCQQPWVRDYQYHAANYSWGRIREYMWLTEDSPGRKLQFD